MDWKLIDHLYNSKNVTQTANDLYISQPSLTKKVKKIESEFDIEIYYRKSRGIVFTKQGEYLAQEARKIASELDTIKQNAINMNEQVSGKLNIGVSNHFAKYRLPSILNRFQSIYPKVEFTIISGYSKEVFELMNTENIHVGFIRGSYDWNGCKQLLHEDSMCLVANEKINLSNLPSIPRIDYRTGTVTNSIIEEWWDEHYHKPPTVGMFVDNMEGCKEMVLNGLGYGILPESILGDHDSIFKVKLMKQDKTPLSVNTWMYYTESLLESKVISEFVHFIQN